MDEYSAPGSKGEDYSAYVIYGGEFTSQLAAAFSTHKPKVVANIQIQFALNGVPADKATGKTVELWTVENVMILRDHATANITVYQSSLGAEVYTLHLRHQNGKWIFESKTLDAISCLDHADEDERLFNHRYPQHVGDGAFVADGGLV